MALTFWCDCDPADEVLAEMAALAPLNPFCTSACVAARRAQGIPVWVAGLRDSARLTWAVPVLVRPGDALEMETLPSTPNGLFWEEFRAFCRWRGATFFEVSTLGTLAGAVPALPGEAWRRPRVEYIIWLTNRDLGKGLSSNQQRNLRRARKAGVALRIATDPTACVEQVRLMALSMERRQERGEVVTADTRAETYIPYLRAGAGQVYQAVAGEVVLSSGVILFAERAAYYLAAGTTPEGMACGASPFLIYEIASDLQRRGYEVFNLGAAAFDNAGLRRFKLELGAEELSLECAGYFIGGKVWRRCRAALRVVGGRVRDFLRDEGRFADVVPEPAASTSA
ncbi:MAG: GNAT family N-acetyltransferase [Gemmataceae bacterium]|nr:GNAT family N-acetyltransferase [Gemmataceae bacterium]